MKILLAVLSCCCFVFAAFSQPNIELVTFASGFTRPVDIAHCGSDDRLFIVEQRGIIWILDKNGVRLPTPFLNIDPRVGSTQNEQGLLGLAFHPNYANNGYFYVNYTDNSGDTRISRFSVSANNPDVADPNSEKQLIFVDQPYTNHNGGCMKFGPDGYLYTGLGDGGSANDPQANGQKRTSLLGKMLRIDVDNGDPYAIPPDNPFANDNFTLDEIWALGLRNPWRFSFDRLNGDLWIGDVGQGTWEEIDWQPASSKGGENYGWRCYEGNMPFNLANCDSPNTMTFPVYQYANTSSSGTGCSVTGGFVYRGCRFPELYGRYLYTDFCSGRIWSLTPDSIGGWNNVELANLANNDFSSFGENRNGELFLAGLASGNIYRLTEKTTAFTYDATTAEPVCPGDDGGAIFFNFSGGNNPIQVAWSTGDTTAQIANLPAGDYAVTITGGNGCTATERFVLDNKINYSLTVIDASCPGYLDGIIEVSVTGNTEPVTVEITGPNGPSSGVYLLAGTYFIQITADEGCTILDTVEVGLLYAFDLPVITMTDDSILSAPPGFSNYQWMLNGQFIPGATGQVYVAQANGEYTVQVVSQEGCLALSEPVTVILTPAFESTGLNWLSLSPNPFGQSFQLELAATQPLKLALTLTKSNGQTLFSESVSVSGSWSKLYNLQHLPAGVYFLKIKTERGEWVERVVKQ